MSYDPRDDWQIFTPRGSLAECILDPGQYDCERFIWPFEMLASIALPAAFLLFAFGMIRGSRAQKSMALVILIVSIGCLWVSFRLS